MFIVYIIIKIPSCVPQLRLNSAITLVASRWVNLILIFSSITHALSGNIVVVQE